MKRTKICVERPKGQEAKLGNLNGSIMSKSSLLPDIFVILLRKTGDISSLTLVARPLRT